MGNLYKRGSSEGHQKHSCGHWQNASIVVSLTLTLYHTKSDK